jgi:RNA polymerase sigma-70 factor (ECF subfamily)
MGNADRTAARALEAYLVAAARLGDRAAAERLVRLTAPRLAAHAVRLLGEVEAARDVVQEAWAEIFRGLGGLRAEAAFLPWALRIVTRRVARSIARRQRDRRLAADWAAEAETAVPEPGPGAVDAAKVRAALALLPPVQAATMALFYLEDMTTAEVAAATDVPVGTVKTRLMHARDRLRALLQGEEDGQAR